MMKFGTWYQINLGDEKEWGEDFARIRETGFDFVVLWNLEFGNNELRPIIYCPKKTIRALDALRLVGLKGYLGVWNPSMMGKTPRKYRVAGVDGKTLNRPNIYNEEWLRKKWLPYVRLLAKKFYKHPTYQGAYFDDSFSTRELHSPYFSYSVQDRKQFRDWLRAKYNSIENLNAKYRMKKRLKSFAAINPPSAPEEKRQEEPSAYLALWGDWMQARADWAENFACQTKAAYRQIDNNSDHELVLSDYDYYLQRNLLHYGIDYKRVVGHFDRFEVYLADEYRGLKLKDLLANVKNAVHLGRGLALSKPFQFHTWFAEPFNFTPFPVNWLEAIIKCAVNNGADAVEIYTYNIYKWTTYAKGKDPEPFKEISLKYCPNLRKRIRKLIASLKR